jgi:hypothetical protein
MKLSVLSCWVIRAQSISEELVDTNQRWIRLENYSNNILALYGGYKVDFPNASAIEWLSAKPIP